LRQGFVDLQEAWWVSCRGWGQKVGFINVIEVAN
jgi:hypothetical protein